LSKNRSKTVTDSIEETRLYHSRYLRAMNNPLRRDILRIIKENNYTIEELENKTNLNKAKLKWHLDILENGFCIEINVKQEKTFYTLTQEGKVIDFLE
jgi:predicted transcriptional regulator